MRNGLVVSINDRKAEVYSGLFVVPTLAVAMRQFAGAVEADATMKAHPEDFRLVQVGEYNLDTGELLPVYPPQLIIEAAELVRRESRELPGQLALLPEGV